MIRLIYHGGQLEIEDREATLRLLEHEQTQRLRAEAEQAALSQAYTVKALALRLAISESRAYELLHQGLIGFCLCGQKNYRVSERAVRRFEDGLPPLRATPTR